jgi:hypothetical protein
MEIKTPDPVLVAFAKESVAKWRETVEKELKKLPSRPSRIQLVDHAEMCGLIWFIDYAIETQQKFTDIFGEYELAMQDIRKLLDDKGTRAQIVERLDKLKKDVGFTQ